MISGGDASTSAKTALAPPADGLAPDDKAPAALSPKPAPRPGDEKVVAAVVPEPAAAPRSETEETVEADAPGALEEESVAASDGAAESPAAQDPLAAAVAAAVAEVMATEPSAGETDEGAGDGATGQAPKFAPAAPPRPVRSAALASGPANAAVAEPRAAAAASEIQIQLGAFDSEEIAAAEWTRLKAGNGDLLTGRGRVIMPVQSGGRTLWRLRAGPFDAIADAAALCRGFHARNEACIVARAR